MSIIEEKFATYHRTKLNEQAISVERIHFYKTDKKINPRQESPFKYLPGNIPVLVSAPHAVRHVRQRKIKKSDEYTGAIAYLLNQLTGCHALAVTKIYGGDPNFNSPCIYKDHLKELCANHPISLVLDLHGAGSDHEFDVDLGIMAGESLLGHTKTLNMIIKHFRAGGLSRVSQNYFAAAGPNTITRFVSQELGIPAIQIEINRKYRVPAQNAQGFNRLMAILTEIINSAK